MVLLIGSFIGLLVWLSRYEDKKAKLPSLKEVKGLRTLVAEADTIFRLMNNPTSLETFDILTDETKQRINNWTATHRKLGA